MGYLEDQVEKLGKRIQKIKTNPDPAKPRSNLLMYEAELEHRKAQIAAQQEGRPFALAGSNFAILPRALGFEMLDATRSADRIGLEKTSYYFDRVNELGFPQFFCERTILCLPLLLEGGGLPRPNVIIASQGACELSGFSFNAVAKLLNIPIFYINIPFEYDYRSQLGYVASQLEEFIAFAEEKVPGIKYDEDKLRGLVEVYSEWYALNHQIYELRKRVPCPAHPQDVFREPFRPGVFPNPGKIVDYVRAVRDELSVKVERGYSPVKEERLRLMWTSTGPYGSKIWDLLLERGVTVPYVQFGDTARWYSVGYPGMGDTTEYGRKLSPIEEVARGISANSFGCTAKMWIDQALVACRECKIDAIVNFDQEGCIPVVGFSRLLKDTAERELGIPTLNIVGRQQVHEKEDEELFLEQVDNFITGCLKGKGF